jgi:hypothetical protein
MTIKSQIEYRCPACNCAWLPFAAGNACPKCGRATPDSEVTPIISEALESAKFNKKLYGHIDLEFWMARKLGDNYLKWGFTALQAAEQNPKVPAADIAIGALMQVDLEELAPYREHVAAFLTTLIEQYRAAVLANPSDWEKIPDPEKPFFGRKTIED